jgi:hypothetical protein
MVFMHMTGPDLVGLIPAAVALIATGGFVGVSLALSKWKRAGR